MQSSLGGGSSGAAVFPSPFAHTPFEEESKADRKRRKDAEKLLETRPLDPWERYRALADQVHHLLDVTELADRKTRFGLVILGTLNAVNVLVALRAPQPGTHGANHLFIQLYVVGYVLLSLYAFVFAIVALRPRSQEMSGGGEIDCDPDSYYDRWRQAEMSQVNREMAVRSHLLAHANAEKFQAIRRVYQGLLVLVTLTALLAIFIGIQALTKG
jgi:hypothetical protein